MCLLESFQDPTPTDLLNLERPKRKTEESLQIKSQKNRKENQFKNRLTTQLIRNSEINTLIKLNLTNILSNLKSSKEFENLK
jgi:hypothetical protein